jgi:hypothetical protein
MPGVGDLAGNNPVMDVRSLPLYGKLKEALSEEGFMYKGKLFLMIYDKKQSAHILQEGILVFTASMLTLILLKRAQKAYHASSKALVSVILDYFSLFQAISTNR